MYLTFVFLYMCVYMIVCVRAHSGVCACVCIYVLGVSTLIITDR